MTLDATLRAGALTGLIVLTLPPAPAIRAQQNAIPTGTGVVAGRVVDAVTGAGVPAAEVTLRVFLPGGPSTSARQIASTEGRFEFAGVGAGSVLLQATAVGYVAGASGKTLPWDHGRGFELRAGERRADLVVTVWPGATITGTVRDEAGDAVPQVIVHPLMGEYRAGRRSWEIVSGGRPGYVQNDDRGMYRITDLQPADYVVMSPAPGSHPGLAPARGTWHTTGFSGGARSVRYAQVITLGAGERRDGVDLVVTFGAAGRFAVSGRIDAPAPLETPLIVRLAPLDGLDNLLSFGELTARTDAQGAFRFAAVPEGEYRLQTWKMPSVGRDAVQHSQETGLVGRQDGLLLVPPATRENGQPLPPTPSDPTWVADQPLVVHRTVADLVVPVRRGARITGRVVFEGGIPPPAADLTRVAVGVAPVFGRTVGVIPGGRVEADGRFTTVGLPPGPYELQIVPGLSRVPWAADWKAVAMTIDGRVVTGQPIDVDAADVDVTVLFSHRQTLATVEVTVRDTQGRPVPDVWVIRIPRDPTMRGSVFLAPDCLGNPPNRTDASGKLIDPNLWPGCDYLFAATRDLPRNWMAPEYLESLAGTATPGRLNGGGTYRVDVTLRP